MFKFFQLYGFKDEDESVQDAQDAQDAQDGQDAQDEKSHIRETCSDEAIKNFIPKSLLSNFSNQ